MDFPVTFVDSFLFMSIFLLEVVDKQFEALRASVLVKTLHFGQNGISSWYAWLSSAEEDLLPLGWLAMEILELICMDPIFVPLPMSWKAV